MPRALTELTQGEKISFIKECHLLGPQIMKLQLMPRSPTIGAIKSKGNSNLQLLQEEFVLKLLNRRWMLEKPDTKIHQITFSKGQRQFGKGYFGDIHFSINTNPNLGDDLKEPSSKDASFYIVRDDLLHPLVNGNKARKLDALLPLVEDNSGTDVVTCGGCQSAHAASVAVSCAERGITSHLLLRGEEPEILTGYNLVSKMYGNVVYVPRSLYAKREEMLIRHANEVAGANGSVLWFKDLSCSAFPTNGPARTEPERISGNHRRKVVIVNEGAGDAVALLGAIRLVHYLSQSHLLGDRPCTFVVDAGTGTTAVGLGLGALCLGLPWKVAAVTLADTVDGYKAQENRLISDFKCFGDFNPLELTLNGSTDELISWTDRIKPRKFGKVLGGEVKACQQIATQTGISVDPVYTLAAWEQAMLLCQKEGKEGRKIVMLHTGGTLGMFGLAQRYKSDFSSL